MEALFWLATPEDLLWFATLVALVAGLSGNATAWPLLASVAACRGLRWWEIEFDRTLWFTIDMVVLAAFVCVALSRERYTKIDVWLFVATVLLFGPGFYAYGLPPAEAYLWSTLAAVAQLLLTLRPRAALAMFAGLARRIGRTDDRWDRFEAAFS